MAKLQLSWILAVVATACLNVEAEPEVVDEPCAAGEGRGEDGTCAPCAADEVVVAGSCTACPPGEVKDGAICRPCDASCEGLECGATSECGQRCFGACWTRLAPSTSGEPAVAVCGEDPIDEEGARPARRENACVAYDESSGRFLVFGGERLDLWNDPRCRPESTGQYCDNRRACDLGDTWLVDAVPGAPGFERVASEAPIDRFDASCVSTPRGVVLFGGLENRIDTYETSYSANVEEDLWSFRDGAWTRLPHVLGLGRVHEAGATFDPRTAELIVVGGCIDRTYVAERICAGDPVVGPLACVQRDEIELNGFDWPMGADLVYDPRGERLLLVGGVVGGPYVDGDGVVHPGCGTDAPASKKSWELLRGGPGGRRWRFRELPALAGFGASESTLAAGERGVLRIGGIDRDPTLENQVQDLGCLLQGSSWACMSPLSALGPGKRDQSSLAWGGGRFLLVGGSIGTGLSGDDYWSFTPPEPP